MLRLWFIIFVMDNSLISLKLLFIKCLYLIFVKMKIILNMIGQGSSVSALRHFMTHLLILGHAPIANRS